MKIEMLKIAEIQPLQFEDVKSVMESVSLELWGLSLNEICEYDSLSDLDDIQGSYFENGGNFMVLLDGETVVGTGGLHKSGDRSCSLKRLWLLKPYRGLGCGKQIMQLLLEFAKARGYKSVTLTVSTPHLQEPAMGLYRKMGFVPVDQRIPYDGFGLRMEMSLL